jgi:hypothetical protein
MYVDISQSAVTVTDIGDLTRLSVRVGAGTTVDAVDEALQESGLGLLRDGQALLAVADLRRRGPADDADWTHRFTAMVKYAASREWIADDGRYLVAHIETLSHEG